MAVQELLVRLGLDSGSFSKKLQGINKEIKILDNTFEGISGEFKNFENTQYGLAKKTEYLTQKIDLLQGASGQCKEHMNKLTQEISELEGKMGEFSTKLQAVGNELVKNERELSLANEQYKQVASSVKNLQGIETVFEEANASITKHTKIISDSEKSYNGLNKNIDKNKASIDELNQKNSLLDKKIVEVCKALKLNEKEVVGLANQYAKTQAKVQQLTKQYDIVTKKYGENSAQATKLKAEMDKYNATAERQKQLISALPHEVTELSVAYGENAIKIEKLELANKNMAKTQTTLKNNIKESQAEIKKQENAYKQAQEQLKRYGVESDNLEKSLKQVKLLLAQENSALKETSGNVKAYESRIKSLNEEQIKLQQQLDKTKKNLQRKAQEMQETQEKMTSYTATVQKLNRELKETEIDKMFTGLNGKAQMLGDLGGVLTNFGSQVKNLGMTFTYGLSMPIAGFGATASKTFLDFEERMRKVNATFGGSSDSMGGQFDYLSEKARKFGRETEWTAQQVGEAYEYMAMAGWDVEKSTESMNSLLALASIGMLDLGQATDIVTDTITPFSDHLKTLGEQAKANGEEFNEAEYMVDIFAQTIRKSNTNIELMGETLKYSASVSAEAGASFEDVAIAIGMMGNSGVKGSMAGTSLAQGITRLLAPTDKATSLMKEFGIEVAKNSDGGIDLDGTIKNLQKGFSQMGDDVKVANAKVIFGQTALKGWLPLITASSQEYDKLAESIRNSAGATDEMMAEIEKSGAYQFKIMKSAIQDFLIVVGDALAPAMKDIAESVTNMATKLSNWVTKMKETNPEMLALIGKLGMMAVIVPPLIMMFGGLTQGLGFLFTGTSKTITSFTKFAKQTKMVANGVAITDGKVGIFAKGLGTLVSSFGATTVAIGGAVAVFGTLAIAIGSNEKALSWLQDKFGVFGTAIGVICESLYGTFQLTFGNLGHLLMGVGKSIGALLTGNWRDIDDIWRETWADMENTTAKAFSNMSAESSLGISKIRKASKEELALLENGYKTTYENIKNLTRDNYKDVAKEIQGFASGLNSDMLTMFRGTSDSMAVMLDSIYEGMNPDFMLKQLEENLKGMASSGKYSAEELQRDFKKAFDLIQQNASTSSTQVGEEVTKITKHISRMAQDGVDNVARNISGTLDSMDEATFKTLKSLGGTWESLFKGVEFGSENTASVIVQNLKNMGGDTAKIINGLNEELQGGFDETGKRIDDVNSKTQETTQSTAEAFSTMVETIKENSTTGMDEVATIFANGLSTLDAETITSLQNTSNEWYSILHGTVNENGELVDNFAQQILWNLGWVSEQTPEKLEGFKDGLLQSLVEANLITADEMKAIVQTIDEKTQEAVEGSEGTGEDVKNNVAPTGTAEKVKEELDAVTGAYHEKTEEIGNASAKAGEEAQKKFDEKVSQLGKDVQVDSNIINIEALGTQFQNAGTLAVQNFVTGWSNNNGLITEAINLSLSGLTTDLSSHFENIHIHMDALTQKTAIFNDIVLKLRENFTALNQLGLKELSGDITILKDGLSQVAENGKDAYNNIDTLASFSVAGLNGSIDSTNSKLLEVKRNINGCSTEMQIFATKNLTGLNGQITKVKDSTNKAKDSVVNLIKEIDKLISKKLTNLHSGIDGITSRLQSAVNKSSELKGKLQDLNYVTFDSLINRLSNLNSWLNTIRNSARNTTYAMQEVKKPSLFNLEGINSGVDYLNNLYSRTSFDANKYQTRGGYYTPNSMAGTTKQAKEVESQKEQLDILKEQNNLLRQLLLATSNIGGDLNVSLEVDGRQIAKSSAKYIEKEISTLNKRKSRLGGSF